jgi:23S rRNA (cytidine1920-2'-O)/16S rRNA (cytidine1409-2'-O)-methyltransferase
MPTKLRLDQLLCERGLAATREKAKALIMAGAVLVNDRPATKPGAPTAADADVRVKQRPQYVSRGAEKLAGALDAFAIDPKNQDWLDIGQSTGGFTDLLLQRGARHVTGVDVGYGQLDLRLRNDPRVTCLERVNARYLAPDAFQSRMFDGAVIDVSFISLEPVLPAVAPHVRPGGLVLALVKPQFEAGREHIGKGGVVRDAGVIQACVDKIIAFGPKTHLRARGQAPSPIRGPKGNQEVFILFEIVGS